MTDLDKKIKGLSDELHIPEEYDKRIEETLSSIPEKEESYRSSGKWHKIGGMGLFLCFLCIGILFFSNDTVANANFLESFKHTIMDFFKAGETESKQLGVKSDKEYAVSKPDLMIELKEKVIDNQNIFLMIEIIAPSDVEFQDNISFDYFSFNKGSNYNSSEIFSGATDCELLEVLKGKKNIATYVLSLSTDEELREGSKMSLFIKDLVENPNTENKKMLVEGMWTIPFEVEYTVLKKIEKKGTPDMTYPFMDTEASLSKVRVTPLGMTVVSDVSKAPYDELGVSDTTIAVRLKMIDGSQKVVRSHDMEEDTIVDSGSTYFSEKNGKTYLKDTYQFKKAIDVNKIVGIFIEDFYLSLMG